MTKRFKSLLLTLVAAVGVLLATACSDDGLLEVIPADADYAATINFTRMADQLDIEITDTDIKGPADMKIEFQSISSSVRDGICSLNGAIDASCVNFFGYMSLNADEPQCFFVARLTDPDSFERFVTASPELVKYKIDGFETYSDSPSSTQILVAKNLVWFVPSCNSAETAVKSVRKVLDSAHDKNITKLSSVAERLSGDKVINAVVNVDPLIDLGSNVGYHYMSSEQAMAWASVLPMLKGHWLSLEFDLDDNIFSLTTSAFNAETGDVMTMPGVKEIDADVLKYLPANTIAAYAFGVDNKSLQPMTQQLQVYAGLNPGLKPVFDAISKIDGTIALGFGYSSLADAIKDFSPAKASLFAAVQLQPGAAAHLKSALTRLVATVPDVKVSENGPATQLTFSGLTLNLSDTDNTLFITTQPALTSSSNIFDKDMAGNEMAMELYLPSLADLTSGLCHMQAKTKLTFNDGVSRFSVGFGNLRGSLLSELMKTVNGLNLTFARHDTDAYQPNIDEYGIVPTDSAVIDYDALDDIMESVAD